jgi:hypothetical protein
MVGFFIREGGSTRRARRSGFFGLAEWQAWIGLNLQASSGVSAWKTSRFMTAAFLAFQGDTKTGQM